MFGGKEALPERRRGLRGAWQRKQERKETAANNLARSRPVSALGNVLILLEGHSDAILTVTQPKGHPLAKISVQATWDIVHDFHDLPTEDTVGGIISTWSGKTVELTFANPKDEKAGIIVRSEKGKVLISPETSDDKVVSILKDAVANPLTFVGMYKPGLEPHRKPLK